MPAEVDPVSGDGPAAVIIAVPEDTVDELTDAGLVRDLPTLRGPVFDAVVTVGMDSAALVTLLQAPDTVRAFATWLVERVRHQKDTVRITGRRGDRSINLEVGGDVPVEAVTDFLLAAFREANPQSAPASTADSSAPPSVSG